MKRLLPAAVLIALAATAAIVACASTDGGGSRYEVIVQFSASVTQEDIDAAAALLRAFDEDVDFLVMERFPPAGRALLTTDAPEFCPTVVAELEAESGVESTSCRPWQESDGGDPEAPVTSDEP